MVAFGGDWSLRHKKQNSGAFNLSYKSRGQVYQKTWEPSSVPASVKDTTPTACGNQCHPTKLESRLAYQRQQKTPPWWLVKTRHVINLQNVLTLYPGIPRIRAHTTPSQVPTRCKNPPWKAQCVAPELIDHIHSHQERKRCQECY